MTMEFQLERIANALEDLVSVLTPGVSGEVTARPPVSIVVESHTSAIEQNIGRSGGEEVTEETPAEILKKSEASTKTDGRKEAGRMKRGTPLCCGRCRREGRARMNHSERCRECEHEEWWDE